jgi:hypothetical protein
MNERLAVEGFYWGTFCFEWMAFARLFTVTGEVQRAKHSRFVGAKSPIQRQADRQDFIRVLMK